MSEEILSALSHVPRLPISEHVSAQHVEQVWQFIPRLVRRRIGPTRGVTAGIVTPGLRESIGRDLDRDDAAKLVDHDEMC